MRTGNFILKRYAVTMRAFLYLSLLILCACTSLSGLNLGFYPDPDASPEKFIVCHGYGCSARSYAELTPKQWQTVQQLFQKQSTSPEQERIKIARAIAKIENYVGTIVGLENDQAKAPIRKTSDQELDCVDETVNTTKYLNFLEDDRLLKFHTVGRPAYKGLFIDGTYPHNTATVIERETKQAYVVDSYIHANGEEPVIRTLEDWLKTPTFESVEL